LQRTGSYQVTTARTGRPQRPETGARQNRHVPPTTQHGQFANKSDPDQHPVRRSSLFANSVTTDLQGDPASRQTGPPTPSQPPPAAPSRLIECSPRFQPAATRNRGDERPCRIRTSGSFIARPAAALQLGALAERPQSRCKNALPDLRTLRGSSSCRLTTSHSATVAATGQGGRTATSSSTSFGTTSPPLAFGDGPAWPPRCRRASVGFSAERAFGRFPYRAGCSSAHSGEREPTPQQARVRHPADQYCGHS
jgi:hypothetical protein